MFKDYFTISWREVRRRGLRSWLTLIGVFIGIAAIVSLISLGQGLENAIDKQFQSLGDDKLFITAKGNVLTAGLSIDAIKITTDDLETVRKTSGVDKAAGMIYTTAGMEYNDITRYFFVTGMPVDPEERALIGEAQSYHVMEGRSLEKGDKYKVMLGYSYTDETLFEKEIELGDKVTIHDREFQVIGFLAKIGSPPDDQNKMIPLETYAELFNTDDELGLIIAQSQIGEEPSIVAENIEKELRKARGLDEGKEDFTIQTPEQLLASFSTILDIVQVVLIGIAAISLLVGGIGIMNTMYTSVLEKTKEIGVMKAIGARNNHILLLILIEAGLYGLGGGLIGVLIGIGFAKLTELAFLVVVGPAFLLVEINPYLIIGTLSFSFLVGCISGLAPARKASKLNPVDSLRYE
jgi:putative ABC transport system permease protein